MNINKEDKKILEEQLGRPPRNLVKVAKRCQSNYPQVIITAPILKKENGEVGIFPTTFWLSCPQLNYRIGQLETKGLVKEIKKEIGQDENLVTRLNQAHQNYAQARLSLVNDNKLDKLKEDSFGQYKVLKNSGVGGILNFSGLKCLHTHYAHYLVDQINPVGEKVDKLLAQEYGELDCDDCRKYINC